MTQWGAVTTLETLPSLGLEPVCLEVEDLPVLAEQGERRSLTAGIRGLYQTCHMFDLTIVVGRQRFPAHRAVLASLSRRCCDKVQQALQAADVSTETATAAGADLGVPPPAAAAAQPEAPVGVAVASTPTVPAASASATSSFCRPELHLEGIEDPEAVRILLDVVYGLADDYTASSDDANKDVLRLARQLDLPFLEAMAAQKMVQDLSSANVVSRLATCRDFELREVYSAIEQELVENKSALQEVSNAADVLQHPELLQSLLVMTASVHRPVSSCVAPKPTGGVKRAAEEQTGAAKQMEKSRKVMTARAAGA